MIPALIATALAVGVVLYATRGWQEAGARIDAIAAEVTTTTHAGSDHAMSLLGMHGPEAQAEARRIAADVAAWERELGEAS